jgi:hypothetical protein
MIAYAMSFEIRDILDFFIVKAIAIPKPLHGILRDHKLVFRLQSLHYFGSKVVPSMVTNHICTRGFPSNCPLAIQVHQGQVGEIAFG